MDSKTAFTLLAFLFGGLGLTVAMSLVMPMAIAQIISLTVAIPLVASSINEE